MAPFHPALGHYRYFKGNVGEYITARSLVTSRKLSQVVLFCKKKDPEQNLWIFLLVFYFFFLSFHF